MIRSRAEPLKEKKMIEYLVLRGRRRPHWQIGVTVLAKFQHLKSFMNELRLVNASFASAGRYDLVAGEGGMNDRDF